jgi:hypothetical protein
VCSTFPGQNGPYFFTVTVPSDVPEANAWSVTGSDTYSYPSAPIVERVEGCTSNANATHAYDCPTIGKSDQGEAMRITIYGKNFNKGSTAQLGSSYTTCVGDGSTTTLFCTLTPGAGHEVAVTVIDNDKGLASSPLYGMLDYRAPTLWTISGCHTYTEILAEECTRGGGDLITITGKDFGAHGTPRELVSGMLCDDPEMVTEADDAAAWASLWTEV